MSLARARTVADAVLYEGYVLYPYRASARKNRVRWQFGVLAPRAWSEAGGCEEWWAQTECLLEAPSSSRLIARLRFLQIRRRRIRPMLEDDRQLRPITTVEVDGRLLSTWEEGIDREIDFDFSLAELLHCERVQHFSFAATSEVEDVRRADGVLAARIIREQSPLAGDLRLQVEVIDASRSLLKLRVRAENVTPCAHLTAEREEALPQFLVGVHTLLGLSEGHFLSLA